jgi:hypothetical protein
MRRQCKSLRRDIRSLGGVMRPTARGVEQKAGVERMEGQAGPLIERVGDRGLGRANLMLVLLIVIGAISIALSLSQH